MTTANDPDPDPDLDPDLDALDRATTELVAALDAITDDHWELTTPCSEWNLSALVDHVTGGNWFTAHVLNGDTSDRAMEATVAQFGDRPAGRAAAIESTRAQLAAFNRPEALDRSWHHVVGPLTGRQVLRLRLHDLIVHTWDIAQTIRPPATVPPSLARWGLGELANDDSLMSQHFGLPGARQGRDPATDPAAAYLLAFDR